MDKVIFHNITKKYEKQQITWRTNNREISKTINKSIAYNIKYIKKKVLSKKKKKPQHNQMEKVFTIKHL